MAAKICISSYLLPVIGSHLWFIPYPYIGHSSEYFSGVARPRKNAYCRRNFVSIVYISWDMRYFISASGYRQPSLTYPLSVHRTFFEVLQSCCPTSKTWLLEYRCYYVHNRRYKCYISTSASWPPFWFSTWILVICYFCYRRQLCCLEKHNNDHCIAYHWSFTFVDMMMSFLFRNLYRIVSTDICCRGRHRVTTGNFRWVNYQSVRIEYPEE